MGKGDIRTCRGKIWRGTTGVSRPRKRTRAGLRPAAPVRKVKTLKDLPKAVAEPIVKKPVVEAVKPQVVETVAPVIEKVQIVVENVVVETTSAVEVPAHTREKAIKKKEKTPAKKAGKSAAKKTETKKPAAKKATAKKKK